MKIQPPQIYVTQYSLMKYVTVSKARMEGLSDPLSSDRTREFGVCPVEFKS